MANVVKGSKPVYPITDKEREDIEKIRVQMFENFRLRTIVRRLENTGP